MENKYIFDQKSKVWCREGLRQISYSDGDEAENYLFSVISKANDITTSSKELISAIRDWPSEYHLGAALLRRP